MRTLPEDPNLVTVDWFFHETHVVVWEDPNEALPWVLVWTHDLTGWRREETFQFVWDALARVAVITWSVENDERLVQSDLNVPSDRKAFEHLATQLIAFASASRESTARPHQVRR